MTVPITFVSHDNKLLIKTINKEAVMQFHHCFASYHGVCASETSVDMLYCASEHMTRRARSSVSCVIESKSMLRVLVRVGTNCSCMGSKVN